MDTEKKEKYLELKNVVKSYGARAALAGLSMTVNKGDVYAFLGKNGSGKTTTMDIIANVIPKDGGRVILGTAGGSHMVRVGYLSETPALLPFMTGRQYLGYIADIGGIRKSRISEVLEITDMRRDSTKRIRGYSRGMYQRLGIAAVMLSSPDLLLLDEPTSALDPQGRAEVLTAIRSLAESGVCIVLSTHILSDAENISTRVGILGRSNNFSLPPVTEEFAGVFQPAYGGSVMLAEGTTAEILRDHAGFTEDTTRVTVTFGDGIMREQVQPITAMSGVSQSDFELRERKLTLTVAKGLADSFKRELAGALSELNLPFSGIETERPTLESVYMKLTGAADKTHSLTEVEPQHIN